MQEDERTGADYIAERLQMLYPEQQGRYYGTRIPYFLGGEDPLDGVEVYVSEKGMPHWHYVTYGFSQLYEAEEENCEEEDCEEAADESDDKQKISGYGFELTFRLRKETNEPPIWPISLLQNLAKYVFSSGNCFGAGHHLDCNGRVALEEETKLAALGFCEDPELGEMDTCNGHVVFLEAVALTLDEMYAMMHWDGEKFLAELFDRIPYGIALLDRDSLLEDAAFQKILDRGIEEDGSSSAGFYTSGVKCSMDRENGHLITIEMGAMHVNSFLTMLRGRTEKKRPLYITSDNCVLAIEYADQLEYGDEENDFILLRLPMISLKEIQAVLRPCAGTYICKTQPLQFIVTRSEIRDQQGNVVEIIG